MGWCVAGRGGGRQRDDRQDAVYGDVLIEHILTDPFALKLLHDAGLTRRDQARKIPLSLNIRAENEGQIVNLLPESSRRSRISAAYDWPGPGRT